MGKLSINFVGALISFIVMMIFFITKFTQVWPVLIFLPLIVIGFHRINKHYEAVGSQLRTTESDPVIPIEGNVIIVPVAGITKVVENSLNYAKSLICQIKLLLFMLPLIKKKKKYLKKSGKSGSQIFD